MVDPKTKAVSVNSDKLREETMSREVFRHPEFEGCVKLGRVRDWFICAWFSVSLYPLDTPFLRLFQSTWNLNLLTNLNKSFLSQYGL